MLSKEDMRLARSCGLSPEEARRAFDEAARTYERIQYSVDRLYQRKARRAEDDGESMKEWLKRHMSYD